MNKEEHAYEMKKGEWETKRDLALKELNGLIKHKEVLISTIGRRTKEVEQLKKQIQSKPVSLSTMH